MRNRYVMGNRVETILKNRRAAKKRVETIPKKGSYAPSSFFKKAAV